MKKRILVFGKTASLMELVLGKFKREGWDAEAAYSVKQAVRKLGEVEFDALVVGGGVDLSTRTDLQRHITNEFPKTIMINALQGSMVNQVKEALSA